MSEAEKRKRLNYKKNRARLIIIQAVILFAVAAMLIASSVTYYHLDKTYYIEYTENSGVSYKAQYAESEEYGEWIDEGQSYISALTKAFAIDFSYALDMNAADVNYEYSYKIDAQLQIFDEANQLPIYNPTYELVPEKTVTQSSNNNLYIKESVTVDFAKYNEMAKEFVRTYQLRDVSNTLAVKMRIDVIGNSSDFEDRAENEYEITVNIPLTETTFRVFTSESASAGTNKVLACKSDINQDIFKNASVVLFALLLVLTLVFISFIYLTRNEDINYNIRVKRLVRAYESYIQRINNPFDAEGYQPLAVNSFAEMLGIRDTIQQPILMNENEDCTCTKFVIPTNTKLLYVYEIKVDDYDEIYGKEPDAVKESEPSANEEPAVFDASADVAEQPPVAEPAAEEAAEPVIEEAVAPVSEEASEPAPAEEPVEMQPAEALAAEPAAPIAEGNGEESVRLVNGEVVHIRYRTSFTSRLIQSGDEIQGYYTTIKNALLSYEGVKGRTSWAFESFNKGRIQCAKLNVKGTAIHLCLGLNPEEYSVEKYRFVNVGDKPKLDKVPLMIKVKGTKTLKYALELIEEVMNKNGIKRGETPSVDYRMPYETTEALVDRDLVKVILPEGIKIDENTVIQKLDVGEHLKASKLETADK